MKGPTPEQKAKQDRQATWSALYMVAVALVVSVFLFNMCTGGDPAGGDGSGGGGGGGGFDVHTQCMRKANSVYEPDDPMLTDAILKCDRNPRRAIREGF